MLGKSHAVRLLAVLVVLGVVAVPVIDHLATTSTSKSATSTVRANASGATTTEAAPTAGAGCSRDAGTPAACIDQKQLAVPVTSVPPRQPLGWGAAQPHNMADTTMFGSTSTKLSDARRAILASELEQARAAGLAVGTVRNALREGFVKNWTRVDGRGYEYINWSRWTPKLDLSKPTMLLFEDDKPDSRVISVAYNVLGTRAAGPPKDFPLEVIPWHYHHDLCKKGDSVIGNVETDANGKLIGKGAQRCQVAGASYQPQLDDWMVDLWVIPGWENPWGLVSSKHPDMYLKPQPYFPAATYSSAALGAH